MTTKELQKKISVARTTSYGRYKFTYTHRNKDYTLYLNDSVLFDIINYGDPICGTTLKQALTSIKAQICTYYNLH